MAGTYYVATNGNDSNAGTSTSSPWLTFNHAATVVNAGDTTIVENGTYTLTSTVTMTNQGTSSSPITFQAANWHGVTLTYNSSAGVNLANNQKQYITWQGFIIDPGPVVGAFNAPGAEVLVFDGWQMLDCEFLHQTWVGGGPGESGGTDIKNGVKFIRCVWSDQTSGNCGTIGSWGQSDTVNNVVFQDVIMRRNNRQNSFGTNAGVGNKWGLFTSDWVVNDLIDYDNNSDGWWFDTDNDGWIVENSTFFANHASVNSWNPDNVTSATNSTTTFSSATSLDLVNDAVSSSSNTTTTFADNNGLPGNNEEIEFLSGADTGDFTYVTADNSGVLSVSPALPHAPASGDSFVSGLGEGIEFVSGADSLSQTVLAGVNSSGVYTVSPALPHAPANGDTFVYQIGYPGWNWGTGLAEGFASEADDNGTFTNNVGYSNTQCTFYDHSSGGTAYGGTGGIVITNNLFAYDGSGIFFWTDARDTGGATITGNSFKFQPGYSAPWNNWGSGYSNYPSKVGVNFDYNTYSSDANPNKYGWVTWYGPGMLSAGGVTSGDVSGTSNDYFQNTATWDQDLHSADGNVKFDGTTGFLSAKITSTDLPGGTDFTWGDVYYPANTYSTSGIHQINDSNGSTSNTIDSVIDGHTSGSALTIPVVAHTPLTGSGPYTCEVYDLNGRWMTMTIPAGDNTAFIAAVPPYVTCTSANATETYNIPITLSSAPNYNVTATYSPAMPPGAPSGLSATAGNAQVTLSWTAGSGTTTSYSVYRGTTSGGESGTAIAGGITTTAYTNTGLTNGVTYYYKVQAFNSVGSSGYSGEASAKPVAPGGGLLSATTTAAGFSYNLTSVGTTDWEAWAIGTGGNNDGNTYRLSGANLISGYTTINTTNANFNTWNDTRLNLNWTNGTPGNTTGDGGFLFQNADYGVAPNAGWTFSAPADTTTRTLYVLSGGNTVTATLTASLSDGSATAYTYTQNMGTTTVLNLTTITYHAAATGKWLVVTFVKSGNNGSTTNGSVNLTAAWEGTPAGSLTGTFATVTNGSYNLTTLGATDWRAWAVGTGPGNSLITDDDSSGGGKVSNYTRINTTNANFDTWNDSTLSLNWSNGTPTAGKSAEGGFLWENADYGVAPNAGWSFSVPATSSTQNLSVICGGNTVTTTLTASLSDGTATSYTNTQNFGATTAELDYTITYRAGSGSGTLNLTFVKSGNNGSTTNGSADLFAAYLH